VCRDNLRLTGQKLQDTSLLTKQKKRIKALEERLAFAEQHGDDLKRELRETRSQAAENTASVDSLKARIRELEAVEFVMTDRANRYADEVQPRRDEVAQLTEHRSHQDGELARTLRLVGSLRLATEQKDTLVKCAPRWGGQASSRLRACTCHQYVYMCAEHRLPLE
jgi:chromosome segregation ATPase